jgi:uncharacterized protein DUF4864
VIRSPARQGGSRPRLETAITRRSCSHSKRTSSAGHRYWPFGLSRDGHRTCAAWLGTIAGILLATSAVAQPWQQRDPLAEAALPPIQGVDEVDRVAIMAVIAAQLNALQRGDASAAYAYASPLLQAEYPTPASFMEMVRAAYAPVLQAHQAHFKDLVSYRGYPTELVVLIDADGGATTALYLMRRVLGAWKVAGCILAAPPGT